MNEVVVRAMEINKKTTEEHFKGIYIPNVEIGEVCEFNDIWDGEGDGDDALSNGSYSLKITEEGEDGTSNCPVWINYEFDIVEEKENILDTILKITKIELL